MDLSNGSNVGVQLCQVGLGCKVNFLQVCLCRVRRNKRKETCEYRLVQQTSFSYMHSQENMQPYGLVSDTAQGKYDTSLVNGLGQNPAQEAQNEQLVQYWARGIHGPRQKRNPYGGRLRVIQGPSKISLGVGDQSSRDFGFDIGVGVGVDSCDPHKYKRCYSQVYIHTYIYIYVVIIVCKKLIYILCYVYIYNNIYRCLFSVSGRKWELPVLNLIG